MSYVAMGHIIVRLKLDFGRRSIALVVETQCIRPSTPAQISAQKGLPSVLQHLLSNGFMYIRSGSYWHRNTHYVVLKELEGAQRIMEFIRFTVQKVH